MNTSLKNAETHYREIFKTDLSLTDNYGDGPVYITTGDAMHEADLYHYVTRGEGITTTFHRKRNAHAFGAELCRRWNLVDRWQRRIDRAKRIAQYVGGVLLLGSAVMLMAAYLYVFGG